MWRRESPVYTGAEQALTTVSTAPVWTCDNGKMQLEGLHSVTEESLAALLGGAGEGARTQQVQEAA